MIPMAISEAKTVLETVKASPNKRMPAIKEDLNVLDLPFHCRNF